MIEFSSSYSLRECVARIQNLDNGIPPLPSIAVTVRRITDENYRFTVSRWAFLNRVVEIAGELSYKQGNTTLVVAKARISLYLRLAILLYLILVVIIFLLNMNNPRYGLVVYFMFLLFPVLPWLLLQYWRSRLINTFKKALAED